MAVYTTPLDVANRALQIIGVPRISALTANVKAALELTFNIDKVRQDILRHSVWTFATRRAVLRPIVSTTVLISFSVYSAAMTYAAGDVVVDTSGFYWISLKASNLANTPGAGGFYPAWGTYSGPIVAQAWATATPYFPGDMVVVSSVVYICVLAHSSTTPPNATYWHVVAGASTIVLVQTSPLGVNPPTGATTRSLYRLPASYIRLAPQDPKAAANVRPGTLAGMMYNDWEVENGHLFTADASPIIFRFVADQTDVTMMDALFIEAWAASLAAASCYALTQSTEKLLKAEQHYAATLSTAKAMNAIEEGSTDPEVPEGGGQQARQ